MPGKWAWEGGVGAEWKQQWLVGRSNGWSASEAERLRVERTQQWLSRRGWGGEVGEEQWSRGWNGAFGAERLEWSNGWSGRSRGWSGEEAAMAFAGWLEWRGSGAERRSTQRFDAAPLQPMAASMAQRLADEHLPSLASLSRARFCLAPKGGTYVCVRTYDRGRFI